MLRGAHSVCFCVNSKKGAEMPNMTYCRFQNTLADLRDCYDAMDEEELSEEEQKARQRLISLCSDITSDYGDEE